MRRFPSSRPLSFVNKGSGVRVGVVASATSSSPTRSFFQQATFTQTIRAQINSFSKPVQYGALASCFLAVFVFGVISGKQDKSRQEQEQAVPDVESISKDMFETFEFRPDLAPTMIRLAFVLCNMRQKQKILNGRKAKILKDNEELIQTGSSVKKGKPMTQIEIDQLVGRQLSMIEHNNASSTNSTSSEATEVSFPDNDPSVDAGWNICSSFDGLDEAVEVLGFHQLASAISMQDLAVIAAITAIRFLKGPWQDLKFRYGRTDDLVEDIILREEKIKTMKLNERDMQAKKKKFFASSSNKAANNNNGTSFNQLSIEEKLKDPSKFIDSVVKNIKKAIPSLSNDELVALFALHGVGDYHSDVCGLSSDRMVKPSRSNYIISSQYYRTLARLNFHPMEEIARTKKNSEVLDFPQMLQAGIQVQGSKEGEKVKKVAACPVAEYCLLMSSKKNDKDKSDEDDFSDIVRRFSDKEFGEQIWTKSFTNAMQSVFDGGLEELVDSKNRKILKELPEGAYKIGGKSSWYGEKLPKLIRPDYY